MDKEITYHYMYIYCSMFAFRMDEQTKNRVISEQKKNQQKHQTSCSAKCWNRKQIMELEVKRRENSEYRRSQTWKHRQAFNDTCMLNVNFWMSYSTADSTDLNR